MAELATKKVGVEAGWGVAPPLIVIVRLVVVDEFPEPGRASPNGPRAFTGRAKKPSSNFGLQLFGPSPTFYSGFRAGPYGPAHFDSSISYHRRP
ncbi:hypothetical protein MTR_5g018490 [Medicago truncatula]|uniref:Uncharacterized protein n=1 Tax=Medicago truncatula TaxID=3880 RepID=G7K9F7_MEDTR|nr:hypothetical protein MTR_5g018490 [Medicago truncatula]